MSVKEKVESLKLLTLSNEVKQKNNLGDRDFLLFPDMQGIKLTKKVKEFGNISLFQKGKKLYVVFHSSSVANFYKNSEDYNDKDISELEKIDRNASIHNANILNRLEIANNKVFISLPTFFKKFNVVIIKDKIAYGIGSDGAIIKDIVNKFDVDDVELNTDGEISLYKENNNFFTISNSPVHSSNEVDIDFTISVIDELSNVDDLIELVDKRSYKVSLQGLFVDGVNDRLASTDTKSLFIENKKLNSDKQIVVPTYKLFTNKAKIEKLLVGEEKSMYKTKKFDLIVSNIKEEYPNIDRIVPSETSSISVEIKNKEIISLLKNATRRIVRILVKDGVVSIYDIVSGDDSGYDNWIEDENFIGSIENAHDIVLGSVLVDRKMFLSTLSAFSTNIELFISNDRPILIKDDNLKSVVMNFIIQTKEEKHQKDNLRQQEQLKKIEDEKIAKEAELEKQKKEDGVAYDFLMTLKPLQRGKARKVLNKVYRYSNGTMTRKEHTKLAIDNGAKVVKDKYENFPIALEYEDGSFLEITNTEYEFARFLKSSSVQYYKRENSDELQLKIDTIISSIKRSTNLKEKIRLNIELKKFQSLQNK